MYILLVITIFYFVWARNLDTMKFHTIIFGNICLYVNLHVPIGSPTQILPSSYCKYTYHSFPSGHRREKYNKYSCCKHLLLFSRGTVQVLVSNTLDHFINFLLELRWASCCKHLLLFSRGTVQVLNNTLVHYQISGRAPFSFLLFFFSTPVSFGVEAPMTFSYTHREVISAKFTNMAFSPIYRQNDWKRPFQHFLPHFLIHQYFLRISRNTVSFAFFFAFLGDF